MTAGTISRPRSAPRHRALAEPVHNRIAARRHEIEHGRARRRLRWLVAVAAVLILVLLALAISRSPVLAVSRFDIDLGGAQHVSIAQVEFAAGVHLHTPMAGVDVDAAASRLAVLPWVQSATVVRRWPNTLSLRIIERTPVAQVPSSTGGWLLVDESGQLLEARSAPTPGLLQLKSSPVAARAGANIGAGPREALALAGRLPPSLVSRLSDVDGSGGSLHAGIASGGQVRFCGTADLADKILALNTLLARVDPARVATIDVCVPAAPVVTAPAAPAPVLTSPTGSA